jgi:hypothetical protein
MAKLGTCYFKKHFTSGLLEGLTVDCRVTFVPRHYAKKHWSVDMVGEDYQTRATWRVTEMRWEKPQES